MFSNNSISEILGIKGRNLKCTGKISSKIIDGVKFNVLHSTLMYQPYIEFVKRPFPNAFIVLDKFHIVQMFTRDMNKLRVKEMKNSNTNSHEYRVMKIYWKVILAKDWELNGLYFYKYTCYKKLTNTREIKHEILGFSDKLREADFYYQKFLLCIEKSYVEGLKAMLNMDTDKIPKCFRVSVNSLKKHLEYIVNALFTPYTNAVVEGNNNLIKSYKRVSFGFKSYKNMKLRILLRTRYKIQKTAKLVKGILHQLTLHNIKRDS